MEHALSELLNLWMCLSSKFDEVLDLGWVKEILEKRVDKRALLSDANQLFKLHEHTELGYVVNVRAVCDAE